MEPDDALVIATSGTTGDPKGVVLTHTALQASSQITSSQLDVQDALDEWLCCIPVSHIGGFSVITRLYTMESDLRCRGDLMPHCVKKLDDLGQRLYLLSLQH